MGWLLGIGFGAGLWLASGGLRLGGWSWRRRRSPRPATARVWPAYFDDVASGLRAGLAIGPAVWQAGRRLPWLERAAFERAEREWAGGSGLAASLSELSDSLAVPAFTAFVELIRLASTQGSSRLPALVAELAEQNRSQLQLLDEVRGRQATTVNAAKVAVGAPWVVLALTASRPDVREVYLTSAGALVLASVAAISTIAYLAMLRLSRIEALRVWQ